MGHTEFEQPQIADDVRIVSYTAYFTNDGELAMVEWSGNLLQGDEIVKSGEAIDMVGDLTQVQRDYFTAPKDTKESQIKTNLGL